VTEKRSKGQGPTSYNCIENRAPHL